MTQGADVTVFDAPDAMRSASDAHRRAGRRIAVVPTMGALHEGHLALLAEASARADVVVVTIFVNPLQFNRSADFAAYPHTLADDLALCRAAGVDAAYVPTAAAMYPPGYDTHVVPGALAERLEGTARPGHFRGVATVVCKLLTATRPDVAVFGEKDFQQLAVVRRMVADLDLGVDVVGVPTVREDDGLALSSRNRRLTDEQRRAAVCVPRALDAIRAAFARGEHDAARLVDIGSRVVAAESSAHLDYLSINDPRTLRSVEQATPEDVASTAIWFDDVRLIDNTVLGAPTIRPRRS